MAASGNLREFERLFNADNSRLHMRDPKGQTVFHHAASKSKTNIMEFIIKHGGGMTTPLTRPIQIGRYLWRDTEIYQVYVMNMSSALSHSYYRTLLFTLGI